LAKRNSTAVLLALPKDDNCEDINGKKWQEFTVGQQQTGDRQAMTDVLYRQRHSQKPRDSILAISTG